DTRVPIAVEYVRGADLKIHTKADDNSPVVTTYRNGESVSVLSKRGGWSEVSMAVGSGWVHSEQLSSAAEATQALADNLTPRFTRAPQPVTQPGIHGELVLEADVNTDGVVVNVRTIRNTTGSLILEQRNTASLRQAVFAPVVRHGKREPFVYEQRVQY
ncbi:MAG: SH3 domain-containing protein, partial [Thermoanaerobaculia bacterium]